MLGLFRLPPIVYWLLSPVGIAAAIWLFISDRESEAQKAIAMNAKPPAAVKLEAFDPRRNTGTAQEVNIIAQADGTQAMEVTRSSKSADVREKWVIVPLYPTTAKDASAPATGVLLQRGDASDEQFEKMVIGEGPFAPLIALDGTMIDASSESEALRTVRDRMEIAPNAIYVDPFEAGRKAGLAPSTKGRDSAIALAIFALFVGLYGIFRHFTLGAGDRAGGYS
jgi:hypothetical protein